MQEQTGFKSALGYSLPEEDKILIRKGLSKDIKKKVLAHEEEHILKGEEGPGFLGKLIGGVGGFIVGGPAGASAGMAIGGAFDSSRDAKKAGEQAVAGNEREIEFARESRDLARADYAPYRDAGTTALEALMSMTGLAGPGSAIQQPGPRQGGGPAGTGPRQLNGPRAVRSSGGRSSSYTDNFIPDQRYGGGPIQGYAGGGHMYNINEMGPENVYQGGSYSRGVGPQTVPPNATGYVAANIQGRAVGGSLGGQNIATSGERDKDSYLGGSGAFGGINPNIGDYSNFTGGGDSNVDGQYGSQPGDPNYFQGGATNYGNATIDNNTGAVDGYTRPQENPGGVEGGYNFMTDPGYEFRTQEGIRALDRSASARGLSLSGGQQKALLRYGQDYASQEYGNVYNRISNIAGLGQVGAQGSGNAALQFGQQAGGAAAASGVNSAYSTLAQGNAWNTAVNDIDWDVFFNKDKSIN